MRVNIKNLGNIHDLIHDEKWTGGELAREVFRRTSILNRHTGPGENIFVIAHGNSPSFFADLLAVWNAGGCAVCINSGLTPEELDTVTRFVSARAVLTDNGDVSTNAAPVIWTAKEPDANDSLPSIRRSLDDPALILFTSGTTGDPKGVVHSYRSILSRLALNQAYIGTDILARSLCVLPTHFGHGLIGNCLTPLLNGDDIYLMHGAGIMDTARLGNILDTHEISFMSSVPAFWKVALKVSPPPVKKTLRRVNIGSAPLGAELWQGVIKWSGTKNVANMYGITETANWIGGAMASQIAPEDGLLGTPWGGSYAILGKEGIPASAGEGEILLQTPSLMTGYYQRPDLTEAVLRYGWYHTGDMGRIDDKGILRMTGRNRYAINKGGIKIYPEELDLLLERHPDVLEACAFSIQDEISGENVGIAVSLKENTIVTEIELDQWIRKRIRPDAVPNRIFKIPEIPKTDRGKLNRDNVAHHCLSQGDAS